MLEIFVAKARNKREGCDGHEVALPRSAAKGIAETK